MGGTGNSGNEKCEWGIDRGNGWKRGFHENWRDWEEQVTPTNLWK